MKSSKNSNEENWHVYVILSKITKSLKPVPRTDTFSQKISQSWKKKKKKKKKKKEENSSNSARKRNEAIERAAVVKMLEARPERHNNQPAPKIARGARSPPPLLRLTYTYYCIISFGLEWFHGRAELAAAERRQGWRKSVPWKREGSESSTILESFDSPLIARNAMRKIKPGNWISFFLP